MAPKSRSKYRITVQTVPHPQPEHAYDLLAKIVLKEVLKQWDKPCDVEHVAILRS